MHVPDPSEDDALLLPDENAARKAGLSKGFAKHLRDHREDYLTVLRRVPGLASAVRNLTASGETFRVIVRRENLELLVPDADGVFATSLRNARGQFVENVSLIKVPPDIAGSLAVIAFQAALTEINAKLDAAIRGIDDLDALIRMSNQGAVQGAMNAIHTATHFEDPRERRDHVMRACSMLERELGALAGQLKATIGRMPKTKTSLRDYLPGGGAGDARKAYDQARADMAILGYGTGKLFGALVDVGEPRAAHAAFDGIRRQMEDAGLRIAADRARLLPFGSVAGGPERPFEAYLELMPVIDMRLRAMQDQRALPVRLDLIPMDLNP